MLAFPVSLILNAFHPVSKPCISSNTIASFSLLTVSISVKSRPLIVLRRESVKLNFSFPVGVREAIIFFAERLTESTLGIPLYTPCHSPPLFFTYPSEIIHPEEVPVISVLESSLGIKKIPAPMLIFTFVALAKFHTRCFDNSLSQSFLLPFDVGVAVFPIELSSFSFHASVRLYLTATFPIVTSLELSKLNTKTCPSRLVRCKLQVPPI